MASESSAAAALAMADTNPTSTTAGVTPPRSLNFGTEEQRDMGDFGDDLPFAGIAQPIGGRDTKNTPVASVSSPYPTTARTSLLPQTASCSDEVERFLPKNPVSHVTSAMGTKLTRKGNFSAHQCRFASAMRTLGLHSRFHCVVRDARGALQTVNVLDTTKCRQALVEMSKQECFALNEPAANALDMLKDNTAIQCMQASVADSLSHSILSTRFQPSDQASIHDLCSQLHHMSM